MKLNPNGKLAWGFVALLGVLHYDFWFWSDRTVVFGFLPIGLLWQVGISIGAGIAWALVVRFAWPTWIEDWADDRDTAAATTTTATATTAAATTRAARGAGDRS